MVKKIEADDKFLNEQGLLVAIALICPTTGTVPVCIVTPYTVCYTVYKDTIIATYDPLEPELPESVNATQSNEATAENCSNREIPEHLKELFLNSSKLLNEEEQSRLENLLIDYQNQFSRNSHDIGRCTLKGGRKMKEMKEIGRANLGQQM